MIDLCIYMALIDDESDKQSFADICQEYKQRMFNLAVAITKDHYCAEEALSIVLYSIARNIKKLDTSQKERTKRYIYKAVKHACYDVLRKRNRDWRICSLDAIGDVIDIDYIVDRMDRDEKYKRIVKFILSMPEKYRDVLSMYYLDEISITVIASTLRRPTSTIKSRLKRGTEMLQELLKKENIYERS